MRLKSLRSKLLISVFTLVIGSGLVISVLATNRFSKSLREAAITQGEYLSQAVALEATNKILINDLIALQNLLNHQLRSNPSVQYLFVVKDGQVLAHTFSEGIPSNLISANSTNVNAKGNFKRIVNESGERYLDFAWPIFSGKAGVLRVGLSERPHQSQVSQLWIQMIAITMIILLLAIAASFLFVRRITKPLSALAGAAEKVDETNLELSVQAVGQDEVDRLTFSFNKMIGRIRDYTRRIEKNTLDLQRAQGQTKSAFEIIQKTWTQDNLKDVCAYLIDKLREIVACSELSLLTLSSSKERLFVFSEVALKTFEEDVCAPTVTVLAQLKRFRYLNTGDFSPDLVPASFQSASQIAAFPIRHESRLLGAVLVGCPGGCNCETREQDVIRLILNYSSGAIKRAIMHEEELHNIARQVNRTTEYCGIVGKDPKMQDIYKLIEDIAPTGYAIG